MAIGETKQRGGGVAGLGEAVGGGYVGPDGLDLGESLAQGYTLPASWFTDPAIFKLEKERIFRRAWQFAGLTSEIPRPGDFFTCHACDIPVVVVRDEADEINAFVNVCRHRGTELVQDERGSRKTLQCPYHAWTYGLDGSLRNAPRADRNPDFDGSNIRLCSLRAETLGPLIFINPDPDAPSLADTFGDWLTIVDKAGADLESVALHEVRNFEVGANWKVMCQNNFECYHCPINHPSLVPVADVNEDMWFQGHEHFMLYSLRLRDAAFGKTGREGFYQLQPGARGHPNPDSGPSDPILSYLFPNVCIGLMGGEGIAIFDLTLPVDVDRSLYHRRYYFSDVHDEQARQDVMEFQDAVYMEDIALCEAVQRGLHSGYYEQGNLMLPKTEPGIHHQERLVYRAMTGQGGQNP